MAKIYPERPPQSIIDDIKRRAELDVFAALKNLPDPYVIFYSTHWQDLDEDKGAREGEADFIIAHPNKGVIFLEVKGGGISFDAYKGQWYSQNRKGESIPIKDPVEQARKCHYKLVDELKRLPGWPEYSVNIWHAVCFPDTMIGQGQSFKTDLPREQIIDHSDLANIRESVDSLFSNLFPDGLERYSPGRDGMRIIEGFLAKSFEFRSPLGIEIEREDEKLIELTDLQFRALSLLGDRKRVAIAGCAGSGKTMLAYFKAKQLSDLGLHVLFLCFNNALADYTRTRLIDTTVTTFHGLCQQAAEQIHFNLRKEPDQEKLFNEVYPQVLLDASDHYGRIYDAIIVDEGQDFHENYWIALESLLKIDGYLFIFYDDNQNIFHGGSDFGGLIQEPAFHLTQNCRNTKLIHEVVKQYHNNPDSLRSYAPEGRKPEIFTYSDGPSLLAILKKQLHHLVVEEQISNHDIVILTPRSQEQTLLKPGTILGNFTLTAQSQPGSQAILVTSIHRFKGLEKRVVIIAELGQHMHHDVDMLLYIGCSRARTQLIIIHEEDFSLTPHQKPATAT
jgi:hypothetical protein